MKNIINMNKNIIIDKKKLNMKKYVPINKNGK